LSRGQRLLCCVHNASFLGFTAHARAAFELISYGRGQIAVKDRKRMERMAGEAYGTPEAEYRRLIG